MTDYCLSSSDLNLSLKLYTKPPVFGLAERCRHVQTSVGVIGEKLACKYLIANGYKLICQNFVCRWGEVDIIASKETKLYFVEVKFRQTATFGRGYEALTRFKRLRLNQTIKLFISDFAFALAADAWQVDLLDIYKNAGKLYVCHYQNIDLL